MPDLAHARRVGTTELRRRWRSTRGNTVQLAALALTALFYLVFAAAATFGGFVAGQALEAGDVETPLTFARYGAAAVLVFPVFIVAFRTLARLGSVEALDGLLTTIPHEDLAAGLLAAEAAWLLGIGGPLLLLAVGALAVGAGSVALAASTLAAALALLAMGVVSGFAVGFAVRALIARSEFVARHKTALGAAVFVAYMGLVVTERLDAVVQPILEAVRVSPVGWFGDLALLPLGLGTAPVLAVAALAATPLVVAGCFAASAWLAGRYWYGDHASGPTGETRSSGFGTGRVGRAVRGLPRPTARVATKSWLRALRAPIKLVYVVYPLFVVVGPISQAIQAGEVPHTLPPLLALYGAWATGAAFTLNPIGDEGAVLPVTLTTPVSGRSYVNGLLVAGAGLGGPVTGILTLGTALASSLPVATAVALGVAGAGLPVCAAALAAGIGSAFPKFETSSITRSREAVLPSMYAFAAFSLALMVAWIPAAVGAFAAEPLGESVGVAPAVVAVGGAALTLAVAGAGGWFSYRYAVGTFDGFHLEG